MAKHEVERLLGAASALDVKQNDVALLLKKTQQDDDQAHKAHNVDSQDQATSSDAAPAQADSAQTPAELAAADGVYASDAGAPAYGEFAAAEGGGGLSTGAWVGIGVAAVGAGVLIYEATKSDNNDENATNNVTSVTPSATSVPEGDTVTFTVHGTPGQTFNWVLSGVQAPDVQGGALSGTVLIGQDGVGIVTVNTVADSVNEGNEVMTLTVGGQHADVTLVDSATAQELTLTPGIDQIDLTASAGADIVTGIVDPFELLSNDETTFSNGDVIQGNGQTIVRLVVDSGGTQPADVVRLSDIATVELIAQTNSFFTMPAVSWDNVGEVVYTGGIGGMGVLFTSAQAGLDVVLAPAVNGGFMSASYTTNLFAAFGNSGRGGGSITFGADNNLADISVSMTQPTNTAYINVAGVRQGDVTVDDLTIHGQDVAIATITGFATGNLTVGDVNVDLGNSSTVSVTLSASTDVNVGNETLSVGNSGSISDYAFALSGNLVVGDVSLTAGSNGFITASFTAGTSSGVGNATVGDISVHMGSFTTTGHHDPLQVNVNAANDVTVGNVDIVVGNNTTSGTAHVQFSVTAATANSSGNIVVGDISMVGGDNVEATASLDFSSVGSDVTVGDVNIVVGNELSTAVAASNADAEFYVFNTSGLAGADVTIGDVTLGVGDSGTLDMTVSLSGLSTTAQTGDLGNLTIGNIDLSEGQNATGSVDVNMQQSATTSNLQGMGSLVVGNVDVALGQDATLSVSISQQLSGSVATAPAMGDFTVGNLNATLGIGATLDYYLFATNTAASAGAATSSFDLGHVSVGDVNLVGDDGSFVSITFSFSATNGSIPSVDIGNLNADFGVSAGLTMDVQITALTLGDISMGNATIHLGQAGFLDQDNSSFDILATLGDINSVIIGNVNISAEHLAGISDWAYYVSAMHDINSFDMGNFRVALGATATWTGSNDVTVTAGHDIGTVNFGDTLLSVGTGGSISSTVDRNIYGHDVGDVTFGAVELQAHGMAASLSMDLSVSASAGDIASFTLGDVTLLENATNTQVVNLSVNLTAGAGQIGDVNIGVVEFDYTTASTGALTFTFNQNAVTSGDVTIGGLTLNYTEIGTTLLPITTDQVAFNVFAGAGSVHIGVIDVNIDIESSVTTAAATAEITTLLNLSNILASVTGATIGLGTVDYSGVVYNGQAANPTLTIDVQPYTGNISVVGSDLNDFIIAQTTQNAHGTFTGGAGGDTFDFDGGNGAITQANVDIVTDFQHGVDIIDFDGTPLTNATQYNEGASPFANFAAFLTYANARANDAVPDFLIAGQVTGVNGVFVAYDSDHNGTVDFVIELQGIGLTGPNGLDLADFEFNVASPNGGL
jgi:hypothetical protein